MSMQDIKSLNFEPMRAAYPELANMVGYFFGATGD